MEVNGQKLVVKVGNTAASQNYGRKILHTIWSLLIKMRKFVFAKEKKKWLFLLRIRGGPTKKNYFASALPRNFICYLKWAKN